jgi:hypothetical protein
MSESNDKQQTQEISYNTDFIVKYKKIEDELMEKYDELSDEGKEEADFMMDELYRHEILQVFHLEDINDEKIGDTLMRLWKEMRNYDLVRTFVESYKEHHFGDSFTDDVVFTAFFGYNTFHAIHPCVCEFLKTGTIQEDTWNTFLQASSDLNPFS